jgi:hypothetical protein
MLIPVSSCDEPDTVVTNVVHPDGSVTRKILMRNTKNKFEKPDLQVPFDNTWTITDSLEVSAKGDSTWLKEAVKLFKNVDEINSAYKKDSSVNGKMSRYAVFNKKFRWFNTVYRFSENVDRLLLTGYPLSEFLNKEELVHYYLPDYMKFNKENGADSVRYRILADSIKKDVDIWVMKNIVSLWIEKFAILTGPNSRPELSAGTLKSKEDEFVEIINENQEKFDSLWEKGVLLTKLIGEENAKKYKTEADSAVSIALSTFLVDYKDYSLKIIMPGKLIATNGYIDSTKNILWPVKSDYYLTDQYEMWAESRTPNIWVWIVSVLFLLFVSAGIIMKKSPVRRSANRTKP